MPKSRHRHSQTRNPWRPRRQTTPRHSPPHRPRSRQPNPEYPATRRPCRWKNPAKKRQKPPRHSRRPKNRPCLTTLPPPLWPVAEALNALAPGGAPVAAPAPVAETPVASPQEQNPDPAVEHVNTNLAGKEVFVDGKWKFQLSTQHYAQGFVRLPDGRTVFYGSDGGMVFGEHNINGLPYFFDNSNGNLRTGEVFLPGRGWAFLNPENAEYLTGFHTLPDGRTVYYGSDYAMQFGSQSINGMPYHFDQSNGNLTNQSGESYVPGLGWVYFNRDTRQFAKGLTKLPDGRTVFYGDDGAMLFGQQLVNGTLLEFSHANGQLNTAIGESYVPGKGWTFLDPATLTYAKGLTKLPDGRTVFYGDDGAMLFGQQLVNGTLLEFSNANGQLNSTLGEVHLPGKGWAFLDPATLTYAKGFTKLPDGRTVYYGDDGIMRFGEHVLDGMSYYFSNTNGQLTNTLGESYIPGKGWTFLDPATFRYAKGFFTLPDGRTVYYGSDYAMRTGEQIIEGKFFYLNPSNGQLALGFTKLPDGRTVYYHNTNGMQFGFLTLGADTFYFDPTTGNMVTGEQNVAGVGYVYADPTTGKLAQNQFIHFQNERMVFYGADHVMKDDGFFFFDGWVYVAGADGNIHRGWGRDENGDQFRCDPVTGIMETGLLSSYSWDVFYSVGTGYEKDIVRHPVTGERILNGTVYLRHYPAYYRNNVKTLFDRITIVTEEDFSYILLGSMPWPPNYPEDALFVDCPGEECQHWKCKLGMYD